LKAGRGYWLGVRSVAGVDLRIKFHRFLLLGLFAGVLFTPIDTSEEPFIYAGRCACVVMPAESAVADQEPLPIFGS